MRSVHIIGIGGIGMSATALLLKEAGWKVSGSDAECYGPPRDILNRAGISFSLGYSPENIPPGTECFVIGRNAKLSPTENAEVRAALESGKPHYSFPEMLGELTRTRRNIVVAGSYGKSTTASVLAHILRHSGIDAGYFIGAEPVRTNWLPAPATFGTAPEFVLEGDEYPSAHDDARAKFMHLHPHDVLLTSVVHDHVNIYPSFTEYQRPFIELLRLLPETGSVIVCADEPGALALAKQSGKTLVTYGLKNGTYTADEIHLGHRSTFALRRDGQILGTIEMGLLGRHNIEDIVGASAYVLERGLLSFEKLQEAVASFQGVRRRLDNIAPTSRIPVFEGFGSSYEKARSAITAIREHFPTKPLVIVFEPHTFGWRNRANLSWYDDVFTEASLVFIAPPERQGAKTHEQLSHPEIIARVQSSGVPVLPYEHPLSVIQSLKGDEIVLVLTSGDLEGTLETLRALAAATFPSSVTANN